VTDPRDEVLDRAKRAVCLDIIGAAAVRGKVRTIKLLPGAGEGDHEFFDTDLGGPRSGRVMPTSMRPVPVFARPEYDSCRTLTGRP